jgi:cytidylate kinase
MNYPKGKLPVIAVDGPSGSGKSTVAKKVAKELGILYIDSGAMYRAVAWATQRLGLDWSQNDLSVQDSFALDSFLQQNQLQYQPQPNVLVSFEGQDLTHEIRSHVISEKASLVSKHKIVRDFLTSWQRKIVASQPAILDGRDIGTVVFPQAVLKYFLTASVDERAQRRYVELIGRGEQVERQILIQDIKQRDQRDQERTLAPLIQAADAILIDTTSKTIEDVVRLIVGNWHDCFKES